MLSIRREILRKLKDQVRPLPGVRFNPRRNVKTSTVDWKPIRSSRTPDEEEARGKGYSRKIVLGLMIAMPAISFYLGTWQVRRLEWKTKLIASCESRLAYKPVPLPKNFTPEMCENWEYRRVLLKGRFLHDEELFVGPRVRNGEKGYLLFTPFVRKDTGQKVLVERGWVSEEKVAPESRTLRHLSLPQGDNVELMCLVRVPRERGSFQWEKSDKSSRLWQVPDLFDMTAVSGCPLIHLQALYDLKDHHWEQEPTTLNTISKPSKWKFWAKTDHSELSTTGEISKQLPSPDGQVDLGEWQLAKAGVPIGKKPKIDLKNNHLQYLITWYGLSFLSSIFLLIALKKFRRGGAISQAQLKREKLKHAQKFM